MSEKLKELLEKINQEGIKEAEKNKKAIESKAKSDAEKVIADAKNTADNIIKDAEVQARKTRENTETVLRQAARDLMLSLKEEIRKTLDKIIAAEANKALSAQEISAVISNLIEKYVDKNGEASDIKVLLKKEDLESLKSTFISKLKTKLKDGIEFKPSPNINSGFSISFDKGKSYFDFTDEGLLEALSNFLNPEIAKLLK